MTLLYITVFIFNVIVFMMPKHLSRIELYSTSLFAIILQMITDIFLEFKYDWYWYFDRGVDYETLWIILGVYPQVSIMFLNFFLLRKRLLMKTIYICSWSLFAIVYEWLFVMVGVFHHDEWKLWYSVPIYPVLYVILLLNFLYMRYLLSTKPKGS